MQGYSYPPPQPPPMMPPPMTQKKPTAWQRYRVARKRTKIGIGCGVLLLALILCMCPVAAIGAANPQKNVTQAPTATDMPTQIVSVATTQPTRQTAKPTAIPTVNLTDTPEPTATSVPTEVPTSVPTAIPTTMPTQAPVATQPPAPTATPVPTGLYGNPWGYNLTAPGNEIYNPPATICNYFPCIKSFWTSTNGYVDECMDGMYSHSGGVTGACSRHGGEAQPLYSH